MKKDAEFQEYPKAMHGPDGAEATVRSEEEEKALGEGWISGHEYWAAFAEREPDSAADVDLAKLKKAELLAHAAEHHDLDLDASMKKEDIVAAIESAREGKAE